MGGCQLQGLDNRSTLMQTTICSENRTGLVGSSGKIGNRSFIRSGSYAKTDWHQTGQNRSKSVNWSNRTGINGDRIIDCASVKCYRSRIVVSQVENDGNRVEVFIKHFCPVPITDFRVDCRSFIEFGVPLPPNFLKPVGDDGECVVNNGNPIPSGSGGIKFEYFSQNMVPLIITSFKCLSPST
ncbi:hypothetical protein PIB30_000129 [Stylosanthes scabra]|uniref:Uncharacterized protein n=1 Tax=Stylosanthes scabra TaxID=79078 RepID=A0ABU6R2T6_9FABA|nr:hypothetical protein [Stylosanthes scabra]